MDDDYKALAQGLRDFADHLDKHGEGMPEPDWGIRAEVSFYFDDKETLAKAAKSLAHGTNAANPLNKEQNIYSYSVNRKFGPLTVEVWSSREAVCEKVQVGTKSVPVTKVIETGEMRDEPIYEYECSPLLG